MPDKPTPENFMLVIREAIGMANSFMTLSREYMQPSEVDMAWFSLIGDTHIRFVLDDVHHMLNVTAEEFFSFGLSTKEAIIVAINNIEKKYGVAEYSEWQQGIYIVSSGEYGGLNSSHFLNERFWLKVDSEFPNGVVAAVIDRGTILFAPLDDSEASSLLMENTLSLKDNSGKFGISKYTYSRINRKWQLIDTSLTKP